MLILGLQRRFAYRALIFGATPTNRKPSCGLHLLASRSTRSRHTSMASQHSKTSHSLSINHPLERQIDEITTHQDLSFQIWTLHSASTRSGNTSVALQHSKSVIPHVDARFHNHPLGKPHSGITHQTNVDSRFPKHPLETHQGHHKTSKPATPCRPGVPRSGY